MDKSTLLSKFIEDTALEGEYTEAGDHKKVNKKYKEIITAVKQIHDLDPEFDLLDPLLRHENESVRKWAASTLLFSNKKEKATEVLRKISTGGGLKAFTAEMTLSEWEKGNLRPFYELDIKELED